MSAGASLLAAAGGSIGRHRRPSTSVGGAPGTPTKKTQVFEKTDEVDEMGLNEDDGENEQGAKSDEEERGADKEFKPVFLKGLFR